MSAHDHRPPPSSAPAAAPGRWQVGSESPAEPPEGTARLAWAEDRSTGRPRYILELSAQENGARSNCLCPHCRTPVLAVNAGRATYKQRPHFRHQAGAEKDACLILAARAAALRLWQEAGVLDLPARRICATQPGLSGQTYDGWAEHGREQVRIASTRLLDPARAVLTLDDGRELLVDLTGEGGRDENENLLQAVITVVVDDPAIASMRPEEIRERLRLLVDTGCWTRHWSDEALQQQAADAATRDADQGLDWLDPREAAEAEGDPVQWRESLLHQVVKDLLAREMRLTLPGLKVEAERRDPHSGRMRRKTLELGRTMATLRSVRLEARVGNIIPDVLAEQLDLRAPGGVSALLVEITVTNRIDAQRLERIKAQKIAAVEIDLSRWGGRVTREELRRLVVEDIDGKRWLHCPHAEQLHQGLLEQLDADIAADAPIVYPPPPPARRTPTPAPATGARPEVDFRFEQLLPSNLQSESWLNYRPPPPAPPPRVELAPEMKAWACTAPLHELAERYLQAIRKHASKRLGERSTVMDSFDRQEIRIALYEAQLAAEMLKLRGFPEAHDPALFGGPVSIIERLLTIQADKPVGMRRGGALDVLRAVREETIHPMRPRWHTLYLIAMATYQADLLQTDADLAQWRERVADSVRIGEQWFIREPTFDALLQVLFPEMAPALRKRRGRR